MLSCFVFASLTLAPPSLAYPAAELSATRSRTLTPSFSHSSAHFAQTTALKTRPTPFLFFGLHTLAKTIGDGSPCFTIGVPEQGGWGPPNSTGMNTYANQGEGVGCRIPPQLETPGSHHWGNSAQLLASRDSSRATRHCFTLLVPPYFLRPVPFCISCPIVPPPHHGYTGTSFEEVFP